MSIYDRYREIMQREQQISSSWTFTIVKPEEAYKTVKRLIEVMGISFVSRGYNKKYHVSDSDEKFETVAAHTNLTTSLLMMFLRWRYGDSETMKTEDGFGFISLIEAMMRHDLAENDTGDIPDDGNRDEEEKLRVEREYQQRYAKLAPGRDVDFESEVLKLLIAMEQHEIPGTGRVLYLSDKVSALLITLYLDSIERPPHILFDSEALTQRDAEEIGVICHGEGEIDRTRPFLASEMWAVDYFRARKIIDYDETGYFTSLIVMATLMIKDEKWYSWREQDYI